MMTRRIGIPQGVIQRIAVAVQFLRIRRPTPLGSPRALRNRIKRRDGARVGARDNRIRRDEAADGRIIIARIIVQQARTIEHLAGVIARGLAHAAAAHLAPGVKLLLAGHAPAARGAERHATEVVTVQVRQHVATPALRAHRHRLPVQGVIGVWVVLEQKPDNRSRV